MKLPGVEGDFGGSWGRGWRGWVGGHRFVNRLALAASPYLRQHAHNPVNWFGWGEEAFARARETGRPVLLSVGYSTCHWCHVMAHESFEDVEIAEYMNSHYVCIKLDREERPDVDAVYMTALQLLTHHGGWPMNVWLDHERRPFFAGTYFPPRDGVRGVGFRSVLEQLYEMFVREPEKIAEAAADITAGIRESAPTTAPAESLASEAILDLALENYQQRFDARQGGLRGAPENFRARYLRAFCFASTHKIVTRPFCKWRLRRCSPWPAAAFTIKSAAAFIAIRPMPNGACRTLKKCFTTMRCSCRHSSKLGSWTRDSEFARVANDTLRWTLREMLCRAAPSLPPPTPTALTPKVIRLRRRVLHLSLSELQTLLGDHVAAFFEADAEGQLGWPQRPCSRASGLVPPEWREKLFAARAERAAPSRDGQDHFRGTAFWLPPWRRAGFAFNNSAYVAQAETTIAVLLAARKGDRLVRIVGGDTLGFLDEYAAVIGALLDLFAATSKPEHLQNALALQAVLDRDFADPNGGYFATGDGHEQLLVRDKPAYDGAELSGNALAGDESTPLVRINPAKNSLLSAARSSS